MKQLFVIVFVVGFVFGYRISYAQDSGNTNSLLWKISGNGLKKPSYLYGTLHAIPKKDFFISDSLISAFNRCKILAIESSGFTTYVPVSQAEKLMDKFWLPKPLSLDSFVTVSQLDTITACLRKYRAYYKKHLSLRPMYLNGILMSRYFHPLIGYENYFESWLVTRNKKKDIQGYMVLTGLEPLKTNVSYWDTLEVDIHSQVQNLLESIRTDFKKYKDLVSDYKKQDIEKMQQFSEKDGDHTMLVVNRNLRWLDKIEKNIQSQPTFLAIGAAHLAGENGLIQLLKELGYELTPVMGSKYYNYALIELGSFPY
jgi:uncharacterized protein YbaP (TraB family)